jgi:pimeloyl-ACP methyl ester carboxylesterase
VRGNAHGAVVAGVAEEISRYITAKGLQQPAVIGHSMGGTIAMIVASRHPAQVGRLMVVDMLPQPSGLFGQSPDGASRLANTLANITGSPNGYGLLGSLVTSFGGSGSDPDVVGRALEELAATDLTTELPRIRAPITVVYAVPGQSLRAETDARFAAAYRGRPGTHLVRIDDSGHMIMFDQPAKMRAAMEEFLKG